MRVPFRTDARGRYRVFNAATYLFYRSASGPPAEDDTAFASNATLPHEPADLFGDGTWYLSVEYFNGIFRSGFLPLGPTGETYLRLDLSGGVETGTPPAGPLQWHIENVGGGVVRIVAIYLQPGTLRAGEWAFAYTVNGSEPATDTPDVTETITASGLGVLVYTLPSQANGTTVKVRLQTRRQDASWIYSESSTVETIVADAAGPTAVRTFEAVQPIGGE